MWKWLGLVLLLSSGLAGAVWAQGSTRFDGQYVGELTLTKRVSGDCTKPPLGAAYPLDIAGGVVRFKYVPRFDTRLVGTIDDNGNFQASARVRGGTIQMTGRIRGGYDVTAYIVSPSCNYTFQTKN